MSQKLHPLLAGGDRRSSARSPRALALVVEHPSRVDELAALTADEDWLVSMRALDLLEKLARTHPERVEPHKHLFIGRPADSDQWEIRLQIVRALPLFSWSGAAKRRAIAILRRDVDFPQTFVRAWALDSLSIFAQHDAALAPHVRRALKAFDASGSKALAARARHIRARLIARRCPLTAGGLGRPS